MSTSTDETLLDIAKGLNIYYVMFLIVFGTVCNILSFIILSRKTYRGTTFSIYLRVLAVVDLFSLYSGLSRHFISAAFDYSTRHSSEIYCKVHQWATATSPDISAWVLVAMTFERVVSITRPLNVRDFFSPKNVGVILFLISAALFILNLPLLVNYGDLVSTENNVTTVIKCQMNKPGMEYFMNNIWYWIDLTKFVLLPSCILAVLNAVIILSVVRSRKHVEKYVTGRPDSSNHNTRRRFVTSQKETSLTVTLLVVNITFIILNSPISIYLIGREYWFPSGFKPTERLVYTCSIMAMYTNSAANFLLYCATGSKFRSQIVELFRCKVPKWNKRGTSSLSSPPLNRQTVVTITDYNI